MHIIQQNSLASWKDMLGFVLSAVLITYKFESKF